MSGPEVAAPGVPYTVSACRSIVQVRRLAVALVHGCPQGSTNNYYIGDWCLFGCVVGEPPYFVDCTAYVRTYSQFGRCGSG